MTALRSNRSRRGVGPRGRSRSAAVPSVVLLAALAAGSARAETHKLAPIVNGRLELGYPSVGALLSFGERAALQPGCTGALAGCRTFVTAAHCVCGHRGEDCRNGRKPNPAAFRVLLPHGGLFTLASIRVPPRFDLDAGKADLAVIELSREVEGIAPLPINRNGRPSFGQAGTIVGFGQTDGATRNAGVKRVGRVVTSACPKSPATLVCWDFREPLGEPGENSNTCQGDSGGPLLVDFGCGPTLAGITSSGDGRIPCGPPETSWDTDVYVYRLFLERAAGDDLDRSTCGTLPPAGTPDAPIYGTTSSIAAGRRHSSHLTVPAGTQRLRVALNGERGPFPEAPLQLALTVERGGSRPSVACRDASGSPFAFCEIAAPEPGPWTATVEATGGRGTYQMTATLFGAAGSPPPTPDGVACEVVARQPCRGASGTCARGVCLGTPDPDGTECAPSGACNAASTCSAATCVSHPRADGTICDDGSRCTADDRCAAGRCVGRAQPLVGCKPRVSLPSRLALGAWRPGSNGDLSWTWRSAETVAPDDLGDPLVDGAYEICVFDRAGGVPQLALAAAAPAGGSWSRDRRGFQYDAPDSRGLNRLALQPSGASPATVLASASNPGIRPRLPLQMDPVVTVQLAGPAACFEVSFDTAIQNDEAAFSATTP